MNFNGFQADCTALSLVERSNAGAKNYEWLYQCTTKENFLSILESRELWLSNLKDVNDKEEVERIGVPEYENKVYVSSFTYDADISNEHWKEYARDIKQGILFGVKKDWFIRSATFMDANNKKMDDIYNAIETDVTKAFAVEKKRQDAENIFCPPNYIQSFNFYKIIYDDVLYLDIRKETQQFGAKGYIVFPEVAGIIKKTKGMCIRNKKLIYEKNWEEEKEVRLKMMINNCVCNDKPSYFSRIAVPLSDDAFNVIKIRFSPEFEGKEEYKNRIEQILEKQSRDCMIEEF